jgi:hypothetical protein
MAATRRRLSLRHPLTLDLMSEPPIGVNPERNKRLAYCGSSFPKNSRRGHLPSKAFCEEQRLSRPPIAGLRRSKGEWRD